MTITNATPPTRAVRDLTRWLDGAGVPWHLVRHPYAAGAVAEARALGRPAELVAKTVVVLTRDGVVTVVVPASARVSAAKLREVLGDDAVLAREDEIRALMPAYDPGALPPFGPCVPAAVLVDPQLLTYGKVHCAAGDCSVSLAIDPEQLVALTGAAVRDISA